MKLVLPLLASGPDLEVWGDHLVAFAWPLLLAVVLGGMVGLERELHGRPAGLRTHVLVCVCSTMLVHTSARVTPELRELVLGIGGESGRLVVDPNRLSAGIVTGIGFLGAATVIRSGDLVRGVTTAACVWFVAGLGVVIGNGAYETATVCTVSVLAALVVLDRVSSRLPQVAYRRLLVRGEAADMRAVSARVVAWLEEREVRTQDVSGSFGHEDGGFELEFHLRLRRKGVCTDVLAEIGALDGVTGAEWATLAQD